METRKKALLLTKRVHALATMQLTRRADLQVHDADFDPGPDLMITLHRASKPGLRQLAVGLSGDWTTLSASKRAARVRSRLHALRRSGPWPFPVVAFYYSMETDLGWYAWASEPLVSPQGGFSLKTHESPSIHPLDTQALDDIIRRVDLWYDAFYARAALAV